jgi:hypothetical protein
MRGLPVIGTDMNNIYLPLTRKFNDEDKFTYSHGVFTREPAAEEGNSQSAKARTQEGENVGN